MMNKKKKYAFSLAEVLLTLVIIAIVAAIAVPPLRKNFSNKQNENIIKKAFLTMKSSYDMLVVHNKGYMTNLYNNTNDFIVALQSKNLGARVCSTATDKCLGRSTWTVSGTFPSGFAASDITGGTPLIFNDGTAASISFSTACTLTVGRFTNACGKFYIDVNGAAPPNTYDEDVFGFVFTRETVEPANIKDVTYKAS